MALKLITAAAAEPVTLAEAKAHLRATDAEDALIGTLILAARQALDGRDGILGRALMEQTWELVLDAFPCPSIDIPLPPLKSVTSVKYIDADGVEQTLAEAAYTVDADSEPGRVVVVDAWPPTKAVPNAVRIRFVAGYADATSVPDGLKAAMLLHIGDLYVNRERGITGTIHAENPAYDSLVFPYRTRLIG
jgi:uncharacterized phiE125 gp8 family phage protein